MDEAAVVKIGQNGSGNRQGKETDAAKELSAHIHTAEGHHRAEAHMLAHDLGLDNLTGNDHRKVKGKDVKPIISYNPEIQAEAEATLDEE